jgi:superoxide dismutase, Cu-Zn family
MKKKHPYLLSSLLCTLAFAGPQKIKQLTIPMYLTKNNQSIGSVIAKQTAHGVLFIPKLHDLPPGIHGFHIHQTANCAKHGKDAGGHWDPKNTKAHLGPYNDAGHLGDLPTLYVDATGHATLARLAPRLNVPELAGHSLMIHADGDNYSDNPKANGGGGARLACGAISNTASQPKVIQ